MNFFDRIITVLDVETTPDVKIEVQRLEFADAENVSTMLNDLIGNVTSKKDDKAPTGKKGSTPSTTPGEPPKSASLAEAVAAAKSNAIRTESATGEVGKSKLGQLSKENIKILADKRTNALVMMGSLGDLAALKEIIKGMDIQLSQVLIETVVLEVSLNDSLETGIDWVKRISTRGNNAYSVSGGGGKNTPQNLFPTETMVDAATNILNGVVSSGKQGIQYYTTLKGLKLDAVITASKSDDGAKVISSPVLLTVDNKEATIEATQLKYMYKGMRYMGGYSQGGIGGYGGGGGYEPDIEQRDVGLTVKVTPRISPNGNVILTVDEKFEDVLGAQTINGQEWPTITTRKLTADVSVANGETVIMGGLVKTSKSSSSSGIPLLKDIPYIGKYLFGSTKKAEDRSEMLVFLTPYVIDKQSDMDKEAQRRKDYINADGVWTKGWSQSKLAEPVPEEEMKQRLERKTAVEKAWQKYREGLEKQRELDAKVDAERSQTTALMQVPAETGATPKSGLMKVTETVEVLKPKEPVEAPQPEPAPAHPAAE
jgi:general secretion pathway protein D